METSRTKQIINNLLSQISAHIEWESKDQYLNWLTLEVGINKEELEELEKDNLLPFPV